MPTTPQSSPFTVSERRAAVCAAAISWAVAAGCAWLAVSTGHTFGHLAQLGLFALTAVACSAAAKVTVELCRDVRAFLRAHLA